MKDFIECLKYLATIKMRLLIKDEVGLTRATIVYKPTGQSHSILLCLKDKDDKYLASEITKMAKTFHLVYIKP